MNRRRIARCLLAAATLAGPTACDKGGGNTGTDSAASSDASSGDADGGDGSDGSDGSPGACDLTGRAFLLDVASANVVEPPDLGALLLSNPDEQVTLGVAGHGATTIDLFFGLTDGSQDPCAATERLSGTWAEPTLSAGPGTLPLSMMGGPAQVVGATLTLNVDAACGGLEGGLLTGQLDTRSLVGLREALDAADPDALCALGPNFGFACVDCADAEPLCIDLRIEDLAGQPAGFDFVERTAADIGSDPACR